MIRRWTGSTAVTVAAVVIAVATAAGGNWIVAVVVAVVLLAFAWLVSPRLAPRSPSWAEAQQLAQTRGVPLILWKPGCAYCIRLRLALGLMGSRAVWVDIWRDEAAAAATRDVNQGNETTPTVLTADRTLTNPPPGAVRALLQAS